MEICGDSSSMFDRSKPVCMSVPKNLGGINPQHLRDALQGAQQLSPSVPIGNQQSEESIVADSPPCASSMVGSPSCEVLSPIMTTSLVTGSLVVPSTLVVQHHAATDNSNHPNCRKPAGNHHPSPAVIQIHNNLLHPASSNPARIDSGLGSGFSSVNSSAASSYKSNSSLCGSL